MPPTAEDDAATHVAGNDLDDAVDRMLSPTLDKRETPKSDEDNEIERMFGDVDLFILPVPEDDGSEVVVGEVEIMVARYDLQGQGYGKALLKAFIWYIMRHHDTIMKEYALGQGIGGVPSLAYLHAKIDKDNAASIALFEGVGFRKVSEEPDYFNCLELRWDVTFERMVKIVEEIEDAQNIREEVYDLAG